MVRDVRTVREEFDDLAELETVFVSLGGVRPIVDSDVDVEVSLGEV